MVRLIPGDTVQILLGTEASAQLEAEALRRALGLDRPLPIQFAEWFRQVVRGDLGQSLRSSQAVLPDIVERFGMTAQLLAVFSMLIALFVAIPLGVASAARGEARRDPWRGCSP